MDFVHFYIPFFDHFYIDIYTERHLYIHENRKNSERKYMFCAYIDLTDKQAKRSCHIEVNLFKRHNIK